MSGEGMLSNAPPAAGRFGAEPDRAAIGACLAKSDGGVWRLLLMRGGKELLSLTIDEAEALAGEVAPLVAIARDPRMFEQ